MVTLVLVIGYTVFIFVNLEIGMLLKWKKAAVRGAALGLVGMLAACGGGGGGDGTFRQEAEIEFVATPSRIALNTQGVRIEDVANRSPYFSTITVTPKLNGDYQSVEVHVQEVGADSSKGSLFTLLRDDMVECNAADTAKSCHGAFQSYSVKAGNSQIFYFSSGFRSGEITLRASAVIKGIDGDIPVTKDIKLTIDGGGAGNGIPDHFGVLKGNASPMPSTSNAYTLEMLDAGNHFVPGSDKHNSMQIAIAEDLAFVRGARLIGNAANGVSNTGRSIMLPTKSNGVGNFSFVAPNQDMTVNLRVTADRADNNIDNGITDAVTNTLQVVVVDSGVQRITFAGPLSTAVRSGANFLELKTGDDNYVGGPDGVYSRLVTVIVSDAQGHPAGIGSRVRFRLVDGPQEGYGVKGRGDFIFTGAKGNPMGEGDKVANFFSAEDGINMTSNYANANIGGAAGFAGCQLVYGNGISALYDNPGAVSGIRETYAPFERGAKGIATLTPCPSPSVCQSATATTPAVRWTANLTENINSKFDTGYSVPWVIGCGAPVGNVEDNLASAMIDSQGKASTRLNYPTTMLGRHFILVAEVERADGRKVGSLMKHWYLSDMRCRPIDPANPNKLCGVQLSAIGSDVDSTDPSKVNLTLNSSGAGSTLLTLNAVDYNQTPMPASVLDIKSVFTNSKLGAAQAALITAEEDLKTAKATLTTVETTIQAAGVGCAIPPVAGSPATCLASHVTSYSTAKTAVTTATTAESAAKLEVAKYSCTPKVDPLSATTGQPFTLTVNACDGTTGTIFITSLEPSNTIEVKVQ